MRRWLALGLLGFLLGCREVTTEWGSTCRLYIDKVTEDCDKYEKKGGLWNQVCPGYREAIQAMKSSVPVDGTFKEKFDAVEPVCDQNLKTFNDLTKNPQDFPREAPAPGAPR